MKLTQLLGLLALAACQCSFAADPSAKLGVVDVRQLVEGSSMMKTMSQDLEKQFSPQKEQLISMQKKLEDDSNNFAKNKSTMTPKDRKDLEAKINNSKNELAQTEQKFRAELYQAQNQSIGKIMEEVKAKVSEVAATKGIEIVFSSNEIVWSTPKIDLTSEVEKKLK
ncbi:MAG: hypothetical protein CMF41_06820 [Legionellales bacterium]|nr:hypothetical protein [Legionellales bacterium]OUX63757.1 MAG: hypothetical protein CBE41_04475 [Gammaproteobacteria bacterium TMED281]|tara:strand:- start:614 stop:1114 length:501 start_codon:yes stop_codon:yes gene_type:complete